MKDILIETIINHVIARSRTDEVKGRRRNLFAMQGERDCRSSIGGSQ